MGDGELFPAPRPTFQHGTLGRRAVVAGLAAIPMLPRAAWAGVPASRHLHFDVFRNNKPIGHHVVSFEPTARGMEVRVNLTLVVRWAGLVLYRYAVRGAETWEGRSLVAAHGETNDDGTSHAMRTTRRDGRLWVEGTHGPGYLAPARSIVSNHWNLSQLDAPMISMQDGQLMEFRIDPRGRTVVDARGVPVEADHFALTGPATLELWYDRQRVWTKLRAMSWEGSVIEYRQG